MSTRCFRNNCALVTIILKQFFCQNKRYPLINSYINRYHIECDVTMNDFSVCEDAQSLSVRPLFFADEFKRVLMSPLSSNQRPSYLP